MPRPLDHRQFVEVKDRSSGAHFWVREDAVDLEMQDPTGKTSPLPGPQKPAVAKDGRRRRQDPNVTTPTPDSSTDTPGETA
jgi:hypothetical protein